MIVVIASDLLQVIGGPERLRGATPSEIRNGESQLVGFVNDLARVSPKLGHDGARRFLQRLRNGSDFTTPASRADELICAIGTDKKGDPPALALRSLMHLPTTRRSATEMASAALADDPDAGTREVAALAKALWGFASSILAVEKEAFDATPAAQEAANKAAAYQVKKAAKRQAAKVAA